MKPKLCNRDSRPLCICPDSSLTTPSAHTQRRRVPHRSKPSTPPKILFCTSSADIPQLICPCAHHLLQVASLDLPPPLPLAWQSLLWMLDFPERNLTKLFCYLIPLGLSHPHPGRSSGERDEQDTGPALTGGGLSSGKIDASQLTIEVGMLLPGENEVLIKQ